MHLADGDAVATFGVTVRQGHPILCRRFRAALARSGCATGRTSTSIWPGGDPGGEERDLGRPIREGVEIGDGDPGLAKFGRLSAGIHSRERQ